MFPNQLLMLKKKVCVIYPGAADDKDVLQKLDPFFHRTPDRIPGRLQPLNAILKVSLLMQLPNLPVYLLSFLRILCLPELLPEFGDRIVQVYETLRHLHGQGFAKIQVESSPEATLQGVLNRLWCG